MKTTRYLSGGKISALAILLTLIMTTALMAQDNFKNSLVDGSWSMQFRVANNFTLSSFEGALISAKKHLSDKTALRFGVSANFKHYNDEYVAEYDQKRTDSRVSLGLKFQLIKYISPKSKLSFYYGLGPNIEYSRNKLEYEYNDTTHEDRYTYNRTLGIGLLFTWGLEWFFTENLSLMAEYGGGVEYSHGIKEDYHNDILGENDTDIFEFFSNNVNFGLSVYF